MASGDVVNLRTIRKQRRRDEARARGTEAAARSGEPAPVVEHRRAEIERERRLLDGHRVERPDGGDR